MVWVYLSFYLQDVPRHFQRNPRMHGKYVGSSSMDPRRETDGETMSFPLNPGCLIGIRIKVYYNAPHNWVV